MTNFLTWIIQFKKDITPTGELARNIEFDKEFPRSKRYNIILEHLESQNTSDNMICIFEEAFLQYQADTKI